MLILCYCSLLQHAAFYRDNICFFSMFTLSRQSFLCRENSFFGSLTLSYKVCRSVHSMSRHSHVCLLEKLCCDIDNCVMTLFLCIFFIIVSRHSFYVATTFLLFLVVTMFLVLSAFLSRPRKSVVTESCLHLT